MKPIFQEASVVLVGSFNPAIFHPEWLLRNGLISEDDLADQDVEIIHQDIARFSLSWLNIQVQHDKFVARTNDPSQFMPLKDLIVSVFTILEHIPIEKMGLNYNVTYDIGNAEDWHSVGNCLAPKSIWEETLPKPVGMKSLAVESPREDEYNGYINVTIGPVRAKGYGINIGVNNHIEKAEGKESLNPPDILMGNWDAAILFAKKIAENTITKALDR